MPNGTFAGDLTPNQAWDMLGAEADAVLVDVRTDAEWTYVGVPDLSSLSKQPLFVAWQQFPDMRPNPRFAFEVRSGGAAPETPLLFLCRSGVRSTSAAIAMTALGFARCYNIASGFEGDADAGRHRGRLGGWKAAALPWVQG